MRRSAKYLVLVSLTMVSLGFLGLVVSGTLLQAPSSGTWAPAPGAMAEARANAAAAALPDGSVLVSGGDGAAGAAVASVELFNLDGSFSSVAPMSFPRSRHVAVALKDGRVLVAGGNGIDGNASNSAEIFDPASGAWQAAGAMLEPRAGATATRLSDGKVLIAGGESSGTASMTLEVFDPTSDTFVPAGVMTSSRKDHAAALLAGDPSAGTSDKVLLAGGSDGTNALASTEIWDAASGAVLAGPLLSVGRAGLSATTLLDGTVLLAGGAAASGEVATTEIFEPATGLVELASSQLGAPRQKHLAIFLPHNSSVLFVGGTSGSAPVPGAELYMPWAGGFTATGQPSAARSDAAASTASEGMLVVAGGCSAGVPTGGTCEAPSNSAEVYGFATIKTDKDDYAPYEIVTITGGGWESGDDVILTLHETNNPEPHPDRVWIVTADANGNLFDNSFYPEQHDVGIRFMLTAEGARSQAQWTFTDAELATAEVTGTNNDVTVVQGGGSVASTINLDASGKIRNTVTSASPATATVNTVYTFAGGVLSSSTPSSAFNFFASGTGCVGGGPSITNCDVTWTGAPTPYSVSASFSADAATGVGDYTVTLSTADGTTAVTNPNATGGKLADAIATSITVHVIAPSNSAPVLDPIGNKTVDEGSLLSFTATASDPDAGQTLTFSLDGGAPAGASITTGGLFTWTPTEAQGPGDYSVTIRVTDNGSPVKDDSETINIHVDEVNSAPVLAAVGNKTVDEEILLTFTATASDSDDPANTLTFSLDAGAPLGASITSGGVFTWTPTEAQGPGDYSVTVRVTDDGDPALDDFETISIHVNEVNKPPVLGAIGDKSVVLGNTLTFTATATDPDLPANTLTFSLIGAPAGATIDGSSGAFSWTPTVAQVGVHTLTVRVTDNGTPTPLSDEETITVTVTFSVCSLYDQTKVHQKNSTVPIKLQLCTAGGINVSSPDIVVTALDVTKVSGALLGTLEDSGNANPDFNFRYDPTLGGTGGYIFNLSTKGLSSGTWRLRFKAGAEPAPPAPSDQPHVVFFGVK